MTEFQDGTLVTMEVMGYQAHAIRKAIRPLFLDPVTRHAHDAWLSVSLFQLWQGVHQYQ